MRLLSRVLSVMKNGVRNAHFLDELAIEKGGVGKIGKGFFDDKTLLIYFSSSWCPSCKIFTPKLKKVYEEAVKENVPLEVLWVSRDRTDADLLKYYNSKLPAFAYFPFGSPQIAEFLTRYEIKTIPAIRLVNSTGRVVSDAVRMPIEKAENGDAPKLIEHWKGLVKT
ncbi:hypothetical protein PFISCL1PPCAC_15716 [Pristionchus fissidentatus]|uniref:protein-disulfide reductase n=1 Tax=Pristionchus fissidentatus TaxID=1538716 RepID=A0AAV5W137_9BILA|nr:hypothetical protein PFISCL1PPCAC_15716 [Pristionchus fissidentatus]